MTYKIQFTRQAARDVKMLTPKLQQKLKEILRTRIATDPYSGKSLTGELKGYYSIRLTYKDRIVYSIVKDKLLVLVVRAKTHYGD